MQLHEALNLTVLDYKQMQNMKLRGGRLFVLTAGMMNENTAAHELALRMAGQEGTCHLFLGLCGSIHTRRPASRRQGR